MLVTTFSIFLVTSILCPSILAMFSVTFMFTLIFFPVSYTCIALYILFLGLCLIPHIGHSLLV